VELSVPLEVELKVGPSWGAMRKLAVTGRTGSGASRP
jgi:hypothetical protein